MKIGLIGDLHGDQVEKFSEIERYLEISEPDFCLQVGDYWTPINWPIPVFWIPGNHERFVNRIHYGEIVEPLNSRILETGILEFGGIRILALAAIPNPSFAPGAVNYKSENLEFCMAQRDIDIFLSHSPGFPFFGYGPQGFMDFQDHSYFTKCQTKICRFWPYSPIQERTEPRYHSYSPWLCS
jgi:predicted phosphodiesterase